MYKEASGYLDRIFELLNEIDSYNYYKSQISKKLDDIFALYQNQKIDSLNYDKLKDAILKGKTRKEVIDYYDSYIILLLKQVQNYNTLIYDSVYRININEVMSDITVKDVKKREVEIKPVAEIEMPAVPHIVEKEEAHEAVTEIKPALEIPVEVQVPEIEKPFVPEIKAEKAGIPLLKKIAGLFTKLAEKLKAWFRDIKEARKEKILKAEAAKKEKLEKKAWKAEKKKIFFTQWIAEVFRPRPKKFYAKKVTEKEAEKKHVKIPLRGFFERLSYKVKSAFRIKKEEKPSALPEELRAEKLELPKGEGVRRFSLRAILADWLNRVFRKKSEYIGEETFISPSLIKLADVSFQEFKRYKEERSIDPEALLKEARKIKKKLAKQKATPLYKPLLIGLIANVTVRRFTNYLISIFPEFFNKLYNSLRLANIQILSNTYANIMIFATTNIFIITSLVYLIISILAFQPLLVAIISGLIVGAICASITFLGFYFYPNTIITSRRKSIKTNMPFAINHIAAIASSGVPPVAMLKLIAESMEYGEFCIELRKIVDYIELFGYDMVTAIRSVAAVTPEEELREFLEGMLNTIESGGELEKFFIAKSQESMSSYEIEREKYAQTVATYSDIYTGILIAAPLFFVAALTLISMLGGTIGGLNISVIIGFGTYLVIPLMNIGFIIFLNLSQPEV